MSGRREDEYDVALVITGHAERSLAHHTFKAVRRCLEVAHAEGLRIEVVGVLDNADSETEAVFRENLEPRGALDALCQSRIVDVSFADAGMSRNEGIARTRAGFVGVLDGDNLPSANWLTEAVRAARAHGGACIIHPERLFIFQGRVEVWPQYGSEDPRMRAENFYDRNYWDTFCLAPREVFSQHPYEATPRAGGFGPEDWHWNLETLHSGIQHLPAPETTLFYRVKLDGSVQASHAASRSLIHRSALLTDPGLAAGVAEEVRSSGRRSRPPRHPLVRRLLKSAPESQNPAPVPLGRVLEWWASVWPWFVRPEHYRHLYPTINHLGDREATRHFRRSGRAEGRRGWLRSDELRAVLVSRFNVAHYRALNVDVLHLSDTEAISHFLSKGRQAGYRARLKLHEKRALRDLDLADYRAAHHDLTSHSDVELVHHYLVHGLPESRRPYLSAEDRLPLQPVDFNQPLLDEISEMHLIEPWIPLPAAIGSTGIRAVGPPPDGSLTRGSRVWWQVVAAFGSRAPDVIFFAPWVRMGGGDILLARYANAVARLRPDARVVVVTTYESSTHSTLLDDAVKFIDLVTLDGFDDLSPDERRHLVATLVTQYRPQLVHAFNSPEFFDAVELFAPALAASSRIFLSTFVIDHGPNGELSSHLAKRKPGYLEPISGVIVDNHALVEQFESLYRFGRERFIVHHQPVTLPAPRPWTAREPGARLQVVWAARFDRQKRLDVLADIVEACSEDGLAVDWHVYGAAVIDAEAESESHLRRLRAAGAQLHGTYASFAELPLDSYDLFLLTSESEGIPLTLLDVLAHRLPVMAPLVGGISELVSEETGWPIQCFDDVAAYREQLRAVAADRDECERRADAAYDLVARDFTWEAFERRLVATTDYLP